MKFKVGDKVRVREDLDVGFSYGAWAFNAKMAEFKGKELIVEKVHGECYQLKENHWYWTDEMLEEVKVEVQEKTFREVIADIKEGEVWESAQNCFQLKEISCIEGRIKFKLEGVFVEKTDNLNNVDTGEGSGQTFKLQRKQCTFEEAFKAYEKGKEIESCLSGFKYKKIDNIDHRSITGNKWSKEESFEIEEIRDKWYINN